MTHMNVVLRCAAGLAVAGLALLHTVSHAESPAWLPVRDANPFVLGNGLPLLPETPDHTGDWRLDASLAEANSQLLSSTAHNSVTYAAETREVRLAFSYAFAEDWSARASLGTYWIGVGFLDRPIQHFHDLIGAPQGYRGGRLGVKPPYVRVDADGRNLFFLDRPAASAAPLLLDVTRRFDASPAQTYGVSASLSVPLGSARDLTDNGHGALALSAFGDWRFAHDAWQAGARVGYVHDGGNDLLPTLARHGAAFGDVYVRAPAVWGWRAQLQYDVHSGFYRDAPNFLAYAGVLTIGLTHALGAHAELQFGVGEDVPIAHTQDVVLTAALRIAAP